MRAFVLAALVLAAFVLVVPSAAEAKPDIPCGPITFDPQTGDGTLSCGPYGCYYGVDYGIRCFG
jgi:hypothetical protein